ncbi:hypothetical protein F8B43_2386 [Methylorubrum populi]|uniref:Uncharacterized protein n=1 Tax=Methylorubrum populi TaxID=223967 RepID=A0A833J477_9HYPH|nr:hypothetical protein F8B43_2386 [Methylorubrum populi]
MRLLGNVWKRGGEPSAGSGRGVSRSGPAARWADREGGRNARRFEGAARRPRLRS